MTQSVQYIDGNFLPSYGSRIKRALSALFNGHAENPYATYTDPDVANHVITDGYTSYNCSRYDHPNSQGTVYILSGLRSTAKGKKFLFEHAKKAQMSVVFGALPVSDSPTETLSEIDKMAKSFLTNPPFFDEHKNKPVFLLAHSTGGHEVTDYLHKGGTDANNLLKRFDCIKIFSGFFRASFVNSFISSVIYPKHADRHADQIYGENLFDRLHIVAKELAGDPVYFDPECTYPTHTEIRYMADAIEPRTAKILDKPFPSLVQRAARLGKVEFIHGEWDGVADRKVAQSVADHMGADFTVMKNTFHNPYTEQRIVALLSHMYNNIREPAKPRLSFLRGAFDSSFLPPFWGARTSRKTSLEIVAPAENLPAIVEKQSTSFPNPVVQ
tara:strand:+ start:361 stop:1512 length:1152 start_codon:yes stop_codon:yes gene_type:complete